MSHLRRLACVLRREEWGLTVVSSGVRGTKHDAAGRQHRSPGLI